MSDDMDKNETLEDIVAALRQEAEDCPDIERSGIYNRYADRFEAAAKRERKTWKEAVLDFCDVFTLVYPPNDGDCPAVLAGAFELLKDAMGIETIETGKGENNGSK